MDHHACVEHVVDNLQQRHLVFRCNAQFYGFKIIRHLRQTSKAARAHSLRCAGARSTAVQILPAWHPIFCSACAAPETLPATASGAALRLPCPWRLNPRQFSPARLPASATPGRSVPAAALCALLFAEDTL